MTKVDIYRIIDYFNTPQASSATRLLLYVCKQLLYSIYIFINNNESKSKGNKELEDKEGEILCLALSSCKCKLKEINFGNTRIGNKTIKVLSNSLANPLWPTSKSLEILVLGGNKYLGDEEVDMLCSGLAHNSSLKDVFLDVCSPNIRILFDQLTE